MINHQNVKLKNSTGVKFQQGKTKIMFNVFPWPQYVILPLLAHLISSPTYSVLYFWTVW